MTDDVLLALLVERGAVEVRTRWLCHAAGHDVWVHDLIASRVTRVPGPSGTYGRDLTKPSWP